MRSLLLMTMLTMSLANAAWREYTEVRELQLDAAGIDAFALDVGAGKLDIRGVSGSNRILVTATIRVDDDDDDARMAIEKYMTLTLEGDGDTAILLARFGDGLLGMGPDASIDLEVQVPEGTAVRIDDSSGSIDVSGLNADVFIDDGSGSIDVSRAGAVEVHDGSGSIDINYANGDVRIDDGSGSISVTNVKGSVYIDDGSGSIKVNVVEQDLVIIGDGSGSLSYANVGGSVEGDIED